MPDVDVKIKGDDSDLKRKFEESAKQAKEFGDKIKEQLNQAKDVAVDFAGEQGLGQIAKQLGGGLGVAAFGTAIAKLFSDSVEAASKFETSITKLGFALTPATAGMARDLEEWVDSISAGMGGLEQNREAFARIVRLFPNHVDDAKSAFVQIQNAALQIGHPVEELADAIAEMKQLGELPRGFLRTMPELAPVIRAHLPFRPPVPGQTPEQEEEGLAAQFKAAAGPAGVADFFIKQILPSIAPGGLQAGVRTTIQETNEAKWDAVGIAFEKMKVELGDELLPDIKRFADYLTANLPEIGEDLKGFAQALAKLIEYIGTIGKGTGDFFHAMGAGMSVEDIRKAREQPANIDWLRTFWNEMTAEFKSANRQNTENAGYLGRALNPQ